MSVYVDTGIIVKLYILEGNSAEAVRLLNGYPDPLPLTRWQEIEAKTAMRLKVFRREISADGLAAAMRRFDADTDAAVWTRVFPAEAVTFRQAELLSSRHAAALGCRSLDILHVATALTIGATNFLTLDVRQAALAKAAGLVVRPT